MLRGLHDPQPMKDRRHVSAFDSRGSAVMNFAALATLGKKQLDNSGHTFTHKHQTVCSQQVFVERVDQSYCTPQTREKHQTVFSFSNILPKTFLLGEFKWIWLVGILGQKHVPQHV